MAKLLIVFLVGLVLSLGSFGYIWYGTSANPADSVIVIIPGSIGVSLLLLSGYIGIRRFVRWLEWG